MPALFCWRADASSWQLEDLFLAGALFLVWLAGVSFWMAALCPDLLEFSFLIG